MASQRNLIVLLTNREIKQLTEPLEAFSDVLKIHDFPQTAKMLNNLRCDLLIIDVATLEEQTLSAVKEFKRNFPHRIVGVLVEANDTLIDNLLSAGADLILDPKSSSDELQQRVRIALHHNTQRRAIATDIEKLHIVSSLPILLKELSNTRQICFQAIKIAINFFNLAAVTITFGENDIYHAATIKKPVLATDQLDDEVIRYDEDNPLLWAIRNRITQIYEDISLIPHFTFSSDLDPHSSAIIVPFGYPGNQQGALAFFLPQKTPIVNQDIFIFEQFAAQLDSILFRSYQSELQARNLSLYERLLDMWSAFAKPQDYDEVLRLLCSAMSAIHGVKNVLVSCQNTHTKENFFLDNLGGDLVRSFEGIDLHQLLDDLLAAQKTSSEIAMIKLRDISPAQAEPLRSRFAAEQYALVPIVASNEKLGAALISFRSSYQLDTLDMHLLENITHIASNALQRVMLKNIGLQNHKELTSITHSIREGIFYVDTAQRVTFCNPQFTELTSIPAAAHINQDVDKLLRAIAMASDSPSHAYNQLHLARQQLLAANGEQSYPIVTVLLAEGNTELSIEFVAIEHSGGQLSWMGVAHSIEPVRGHPVLEPLVEHARPAHARLRSVIDTLTENQGRLSYNEHGELLQNLQISADIAVKRWDEFDDSYQFYFGGTSGQPKAVKLNSLFEHILADERLFWETARLKVNLPLHSPIVTVMNPRLESALSSLFVYLIETLPTDGRLEVKIDEQGEKANILITSTSVSTFSAIEDILVELENWASQKQSDFDLLSTIELIRRSGTQILIEQAENAAKILRMSLPLALSTTHFREEDSSEAELDASSMQSELEMASPRTRSVILIEGRSVLSKRLRVLLETEGYSIRRFPSAMDARLALSASRVDLIVLDQDLEDENSLTTCQEIRQQVTAPILVIADKITGQEKARYMQAGADQLITVSASARELMDTIRGLCNRRSSTVEPQSISLGDLYVDFAHRAVYLKGVLVELTRIEYEVLYTLIVNRGQTVSHEQLLTEVWGPGYEQESQYLWVTISRLRKKLEPDRTAPGYIRTQSGFGYYFALP